MFSTMITNTALLNMTLLTLKVALAATLCAWPVGLALGFVLARKVGRWKPLLETLVIMPMVLPPVSIGLILLYFLRPESFLGDLWIKIFGHGILLTWQAAAVASGVVALPLMAKAAEQAFANVPRRLEKVASTLGLTPFAVFSRVTLPLARLGLIHAALLGFARALGEFGATNLVAGMIPGRTETLALGIYDRITNGHDKEAWILTFVSFALAFGSTLGAHLLLRRKTRSSEAH
jgi:molybdate transport system permease protein